MFEHPILDVHATALGVLLFAADGFGVAEVVGVLGFVAVEVVVVKEVCRLGNSHDQPGLATEVPAVGFPLAGVEHAAQVGAHRSDARARGQHDDVGFLIIGEKHLLAHRAGDLHFCAGLDVAQERGAHPVDGLAIFFIFQLPHAEGNGVVGQVVAVAGAGD